jgi:hypothetical protein
MDEVTLTLRRSHVELIDDLLANRLSTINSRELDDNRACAAMEWIRRKIARALQPVDAGGASG